MPQPPLSPVFVGRRPDSAVLDGALVRARAGAPRAVLVGGEAGVGKTRLLDEFLARAARAGAAVATGACLEFGADGVPYVPLTAALRRLRAADPAVAAAIAESAADPAARHRLSALFPDLAVPDAAAGAPASAAQVFEAAARLFETLAAERPLVLAVEDLHSSDRATLDLLSYLLRGGVDARLLLVATHRTDGLTRRHPIRRHLAELERLSVVDTLRLERLTEDEVRAQIAGILGEEPDPALAEEIFERSEGNAFFVEELAATVRGNAPGTALPDPLRDLLLVRLEALPEPARRVVRLAAEGGPDVEHGLLAAVSAAVDGPTGAGLDDALRAAVDAHLLVPGAEAGDAGGAPGGYRFRHALVREAVADDLLPGERARINLRYAEALRDTPSAIRAEARTARLATYWYRARRPDQALPLTARAAEEAGLRHAHTERLRMLERILDLWPDASPEARAAARLPSRFCEGWPPGPDGAGLPDVLARAAVAARTAGTADRAAVHLERLRRQLDADPAASSPERRAWLLVQEGRVRSTLGLETSGAGDRRALELLDGRPPSRIKAQVFARLGMGALIRGDARDSARLAERASALAREVGSAAQEIDADITLGSALGAAFHDPRGPELVRAAGRRAADRGYAELAARARLNLVSVLTANGRWDEAIAAGEEGQRLAERFGVTRGAGAFLSANLAEALLLSGRPDEAREVLDRRTRRAIAPSTLGFAAQLQAELAVLAGEFAEARRWLAEADRHNNPARLDEAQRTLPRARMLIATADPGDPAARRATARAAVAEVRDAALRLGSDRYALPLAAEAARAEQGLPDDGGREAALAVLEEITAAHGQDGGGRTVPPVWRGWAQLARAEAAQARGARDAARLREQAEETLAGCGVRIRRPAPGPPPGEGGLTPREHEVLALLAEGLSNRRIAERLVISPKTASVHVSNILAKLGVSGRGEAAARYRQRRGAPRERDAPR